MAASSSTSKCPFSHVASIQTGFNIVPAEKHPHYCTIKKSFEDKTGFLSSLSAAGSIFSKMIQKKKSYEERVLNGIASKGLSPCHFHRYHIIPLPMTQGFIFINDPKLTEDILNCLRHEGSTEGYFKLAKPFAELAKVFGDENILVGIEEIHQKHRDYLTPFFSSEATKSYLPILMQDAQDLLNTWGEKMSQPVEITEDLQLLLASNIVKVFFSQSGASPSLCHKINRLSTIIFERLQPFTSKDIHQEECATLIKEFQEEVDLMLSSTEESLLKKMSQAKTPENDSLFTHEEVAGTAKILLFAGQDTTRSILNYLIYYLGINTDLQEKLREKLHNDPEGIEHFIMHSELLQKVIHEGLRLNPPVYMIARKANRDLIVGDELYIPKDWEVYCSNSHMLLDASRWGETATSFNPEREASGDKRFVFGSGPNGCLGRNFALLSIKVFLSSLLKKFVWQTINADAKQVDSVTLRMDAPIRISVHSIHNQF